MAKPRLRRSQPRSGPQPAGDVAVVGVDSISGATRGGYPRAFAGSRPRHRPWTDRGNDALYFAAC